MRKSLSHTCVKLMNMSPWVCVGKRFVGGDIKGEQACTCALFFSFINVLFPYEVLQHMDIQS